MDKIERFNNIFQGYFPAEPPARAVCQPQKLYPGAQVMFTAVACVAQWQPQPTKESSSDVRIRKDKGRGGSVSVGVEEVDLLGNGPLFYGEMVSSSSTPRICE
jgi:hypothetical protein